MAESKTYVRADEKGALRIGDSGVSLDSIAYAFQQGHSPETICDQYPALSLEQAYGAIAYYLANRAEVADYLQRQQKLWEDLKKQTEAAPNPVVQRLRCIRASMRQEQ